MNSFLNQIGIELLGSNLTTVTLTVCYIFATIGAFLHWTFETKKGIKTNIKSPNKFSFSYWINDNIKPKALSLLVSIICIFLVLRFSKFQIIAGLGLYPSALVAGASIDKIMPIIKNFLQKSNSKIVSIIKNFLQKSNSK